MIINEVVVGEAVVVEKLNKDSIIGDEGAGDERVRESLDWHRVVVDAERLIDVELLSADDIGASRLLAKHSEPELAVIDERNGILFTGRILLDLLEPDEAVILTANLLLKSLLIGLKIVHADPVFLVIFLGNHDGPGRIVRYHTRNHGVHRLNALVFGEILEIV